MTVNIISDIHATLDEDGNVIYDYKIPSKTKYDKCLTLFEKFLDENRDDVLKYKIKFFPVRMGDPSRHFIKSHQDIFDCIIQFRKMFNNSFDNISATTIDEMAQKLQCIHEMFELNNSKWQYRKCKLNISDLIEFMYLNACHFDPTKLHPADYLIISGDLSLASCYDEVFNDLEAKTKGKFKKILHIAGNHDNWWISMNGNYDRPLSRDSSHDMMEYVDGEYLFLGCTMWTPISDNDVWTVGRYMNDYKYTPGKFSPFTSRTLYEQQSTWLKTKIASNKDKKIIVFTHHQPFAELTLDDYKHSDVNAAYCVLDHSLDNINEFNNVVLWCCGHTHASYDGILHNVHVVRNPIGYRSLYGWARGENFNDHWYDKIIEI